MEDKTFELLTKMYGEFTEFRQETKTRFDNAEKRIETLGNQVTNLEFELKKDISALYDGYKQTYEKLEIVEGKLDTLSDKVDRHDIKIQVIEGGRKKVLFFIFSPSIAEKSLAVSENLGYGFSHF